MRKKLSKILMLATALMVSISAIKMEPVSAANTKDKAFNFKFTEKKRITDGRIKEDDSSCYMRCVTATTPYKAWVLGGVYGQEYTNCAGKYKYYFEKGDKRYMYNLVVEKAKASGDSDKTLVAAIRVKPDKQKGQASGYWSPDSVYESGVKQGTDYIK